MKENLFIAESRIGLHLAPDIFKANMFTFTFYPVFKKIETPDVLDRVEYYVTNKKNFYLNDKNIYEHYAKNYQSIEDMIIKELKPKYIFVGFDLDLAGQIMASILYYKLVKKGFNEKNIFRIPLTDEGYIKDKNDVFIGFGEFFDKNTLDEVLNAIELENKLINKIKMGFRNAEILRTLYNKTYPDVYKRRNDKTNTITYIVKAMMEEK